MPSKLIVLTGAYGVIEKNLSIDSMEYARTPLFKSIFEELKHSSPPDHWITCPYLGDLLMFREIDRDAEFRPLLNSSEDVVLIEEWHIGNIAWLQSIESQVSTEYTRRLHNLLEGFKSHRVEMWHVSIDPDKIIIPTQQELYRKYLYHLSELGQQFQLIPETLDGEAAPDFISKRIRYMLGRNATT